MFSKKNNTVIKILNSKLRLILINSLINRQKKSILSIYRKRIFLAVPNLTNTSRFLKV